MKLLLTDLPVNRNIYIIYMPQYIDKQVPFPHNQS